MARRDNYRALIFTTATGAFVRTQQMDAYYNPATQTLLRVPKNMLPSLKRLEYPVNLGLVAARSEHSVQMHRGNGRRRHYHSPISVLFASSTASFTLTQTTSARDDQNLAEDLTKLDADDSVYNAIDVVAEALQDVVAQNGPLTQGAGQAAAVIAARLDITAAETDIDIIRNKG